MATDKPKIVCLCGSTRFMDTFVEAYIRGAKAGQIVLSIGVGKANPLWMEAKLQLDTMHFKKIEMADEILVLNVGGYVGESTQREIDYARSLGKKVRWWEHNIPQWKKTLNKLRRKL